MPDIDSILEKLLANRRLRESATFTSRTYSDQPIIQTGKQMRERMERNRQASGRPARPSDAKTPSRASDDAPKPRQSHGSRASQAASTLRQLTFDLGDALHFGNRGNAEIAERYYQLRRLAAGQPSSATTSWKGGFAYGTRAANRLFYEQARFMEDFEDEYDFDGTFSQYYPTYSSMTISQMRGYFSWRTHVRHGEMPVAPLSFAFLYAYELLCGIGTTPGAQGYTDLVAFHRAYDETGQAIGSTFTSYLKRWEHDYVIYHGLDQALLPKGFTDARGDVRTLIDAQRSVLSSEGREPKEQRAEPASSPTPEEVVAALDALSSYNIRGARLFKSDPESVTYVTNATFRELVLHCSRRRKTDFVEGLFGRPALESYTMFASAVFYDPEPHPDVEVTLDSDETFVCSNGRWYRKLLCANADRNKALGTILHEVDRRTRDRLGCAYPLKERKAPVYVVKIIEAAVDELIAKREEEERRRIDIDLSQLGRIRAAAALTQEALLTDEERDEGTVSREEPKLQGERSASTQQAPASEEAPKEAPAAPAAPPSPAVPMTSAPGAPPLTQAEREVLDALLGGTAVPQSPGGQLLSLVVDSINEKLFDLVGDAIIEYEGDIPALIEDYLDDVREMVGA